MACLTKQDYSWELKKTAQFVFQLTVTLQMSNYGTVALLYVFRTILQFLFAANCSLLALRNKILTIWYGIIALF